MKLHHIGIICKSIEKEIQNIKRNFNVLNISEIVFDNNQNAKVCMLKIENSIDFELIEGEVVSNLQKKGVQYYHLCYEVENIDVKIKELQNNGAIIISPPKDALLFNNKKVAFLYLSFGLIELLEL